MSQDGEYFEEGAIRIGQPVQLLLVSGEWLVGRVISVTNKDGELVDLIVQAIGFGPVPVHESELFTLSCPN